jgi:hypothetical protein
MASGVYCLAALVNRGTGWQQSALVSAILTAVLFGIGHAIVHSLKVPIRHTLFCPRGLQSCAIFNIMKTYQIRTNSDSKMRGFFVTDDRQCRERDIKDSFPASLEGSALAKKQGEIAWNMLKPLNTMGTASYGPVGDSTGTRHFYEFLSSDLFKKHFWDREQVLGETEIKAALGIA